MHAYVKLYIEVLYTELELFRSWNVEGFLQRASRSGEGPINEIGVQPEKRWSVSEWGRTFHPVYMGASLLANTLSKFGKEFSLFGLY